MYQNQKSKREIGWKYFNDLVEPYGECLYLDYGVTKINPKNIIGLSYSGVVSEEKLVRLVELVNASGWNDNSPQDLHLLLLPNGYFTVSTGGNHRTILSNKMGLDWIKANVEVLIPYERVSPEVKGQLQSLEKTIEKEDEIFTQVFKEEQAYYDKLEEPPSELHEKRKQQEKKLGRVEEEKRNLIFNEAKRLMLLPYQPRLKVTINKMSRKT
ncbi:hypothetical protein [Aquibacillus albus]|uniref:Uncharacterized protein n=1 Tax=Aquibacillus albus TaxID=1168171 RepID=A0ABS2N3F8_9BACI|nr:hypothetical protein [Aquibacillus albus]MBM7572665.1 hypothetical protein [Aquibacillus albus]